MGCIIGRQFFGQPLSCSSSIQFVVTFGSAKPEIVLSVSLSTLMLLVVTPTGCPREETGLSPIWEPTPHAPEKKEHAVGGEEGRAMMDAEVKLQFFMIMGYYRSICHH